MSDAAVIAVVATSAVAITTTVATIVAAEVRARRASTWAEADNARKQNWAREDELRAVLESASNAFHRAHVALSAASRLVSDGTATSRDEAEAFAELDRRIEALWEDENRLAVRLGLEDPIFAAFVTGVVQYQDARRALRRAAEHGADASSEVKRLGDLAVWLQHEFWHRAAQRVGPGIGVHPGQIRSEDAAHRHACLEPVIDSTLRNLAPRSAPGLAGSPAVKELSAPQTATPPDD